MRRILIADDAEEWRAILATALRTLPDVEVRTAASAEEAIAALDEQHADLLVTDVNMPGMSGLDLLARISGSPQWPQRGAIVISGEHDPDMPDRARALGAIQVFEKPFSAGAIRRCVLSLLDCTYEAR